MELHVESLGECSWILTELYMESLGECSWSLMELNWSGAGAGVELRLEVSPGRCLQRQEDVAHDVPCTEVRIPRREMEQGFREIPVLHKDYRSTDPTTRVLVISEPIGHP